MTDIKQAIQELRPCPFCGGKAESSQTNGYYSIECGNGVDCPVVIEIENCATLSEAIAAWNTRSSVEGGTVNLTSRIEAAAEEIAKEIKLAYGIATDERDVSDITAIIRRHLEVK